MIGTGTYGMFTIDIILLSLESLPPLLLLLFMLLLMLMLLLFARIKVFLFRPFIMPPAEPAAPLLLLLLHCAALLYSVMLSLLFKSAVTEGATAGDGRRFLTVPLGILPFRIIGREGKDISVIVERKN